MKPDKFHEECAVVGVINHPEAAKYCYLGLYAMQHRGQEGAGIVSVSKKGMQTHRGMGLVSEVFSPDVLEDLKGHAAIGHSRYATHGDKDSQNLQPFVASFADSSFAVAHNGNLINAEELKSELEEGGAIFSSTSDTEVILHLVAQDRSETSLVEKYKKALKNVKGAFSLVSLSSTDKLIAVRDPAGVRPLSLAKIGDGYMVASETCAFDLVEAEFVRDIKPGEIIEIDTDGNITSDFLDDIGDPAFCVFEYIYFSRPDSVIEGRDVYQMRKNLGSQLSKEHPVEGDLVIPVPDSGVPAAIGYAQEAGLPMEFGLIRNHYVGRTFIEPKQEIRDFGVKVKLNPNRKIIKGKRVILVDDSIVRGTTCKKIVKMIREAGAKEVHFRISSPPTIGSCYYGIDTPSENELAAVKNTVDEIREYIDADTLGYLSIEGMYKALETKQKGFCDACFSGNYALGKPKACA